MSQSAVSSRIPYIKGPRNTFISHEEIRSRELSFALIHRCIDCPENTSVVLCRLVNRHLSPNFDWQKLKHADTLSKRSQAVILQLSDDLSESLPRRPPYVPPSKQGDYSSLAPSAQGTAGPESTNSSRRTTGQKRRLEALGSLDGPRAPTRPTSSDSASFQARQVAQAGRQSANFTTQQQQQQQQQQQRPDGQRQEHRLLQQQHQLLGNASINDGSSDLPQNQRQQHHPGRLLTSPELQAGHMEFAKRQRRLNAISAELSKEKPPKQPLTSYMLYFREMRPRLLAGLIIVTKYPCTPPGRPAALPPVCLPAHLPTCPFIYGRTKAFFVYVLQRTSYFAPFFGFFFLPCLLSVLLYFASLL